MAASSLPTAAWAAPPGGYATLRSSPGSGIDPISTTSPDANADRSEGRREEGPGGVSHAEREELIKLRREVRQLRLERDILSKAAAWFARARAAKRIEGTIPSGSSGS
jgi:hypothetical protein